MFFICSPVAGSVVLILSWNVPPLQRLDFDRYTCIPPTRKKKVARTVCPKIYTTNGDEQKNRTFYEPNFVLI